VLRPSATATAPERRAAVFLEPCAIRVSDLLSGPA
jgi:hypothetical protein